MIENMSNIVKKVCGFFRGMRYAQLYVWLFCCFSLGGAVAFYSPIKVSDGVLLLGIFVAGILSYMGSQLSVVNKERENRESVINELTEQGWSFIYMLNAYLHSSISWQFKKREVVDSIDRFSAEHDKLVSKRSKFFEEYARLCQSSELNEENEELKKEVRARQAANEDKIKEFKKEKKPEFESLREFLNVKNHELQLEYVKTEVQRKRLVDLYDMSGRVGIVKKDEWDNFNDALSSLEKSLNYIANRVSSAKYHDLTEKELNSTICSQDVIREFLKSMKVNEISGSNNSVSYSQKIVWRCEYLVVFMLSFGAGYIILKSYS